MKICLLFKKNADKINWADDISHLKSIFYKKGLGKIGRPLGIDLHDTPPYFM